MRVCLVYDHVYPTTIGGGERWLHDLAVRLAAEGHTVTYLTMRHGAAPQQVIAGVEVVGLVDAGQVRDDDRRTSGAPLRFGIAVARHLWRHGDRYDVVHVASFPFFPLLGAALARRRRGFTLIADWFEAWTRAYWIRYAGPGTGRVGWLVQKACVRIRCDAICISQHTATRLQAEGFRGRLTVAPGLYDGPVEPSPGEAVRPIVVAAARHIPEKRLPLLVRGFAEARRTHPELTLELFGDGPERPQVERVVAKLGLGEVVTVAGRRPQEELEAAFGRAMCQASASEREGYGLVIVEAAARGTPSVVVEGPENAAAELVVEGVNGAVANEATPASVGAAIVRVVDGGAALRRSTTGWFTANASTLRLDRSLDLIVELYKDSRAR